MRLEIFNFRYIKGNWFIHILSLHHHNTNHTRSLFALIENKTGIWVSGLFIGQAVLLKGKEFIPLQ